MPMSIENIGQFIQSGNMENIVQNGRTIQAPVAPEIAGAEGAEGTRSFGQMLTESIEKTNEIQLQADHAAKELAAGRNKNIHETMLMIEKADMSFRMMMQVRNKILDAYREIIRMQV